MGNTTTSTGNGLQDWITTITNAGSSLIQGVQSWQTQWNAGQTQVQQPVYYNQQPTQSTGFSLGGVNTTALAVIALITIVVLKKVIAK